MTIIPSRVIYSTNLINIALHQDERNGEHPHENHYPSSQPDNHLNNITYKTQIHGHSLMEVDWGPKFLQKKQVDMGVHHTSSFTHLKYDYSCCNHHISYFNSIFISTSCSNPHLSTQTVVDNNLTTIVTNSFSHVKNKNGEYSYGEHHHPEDESSPMEIDWEPKHNNTYILHQLHCYNLNKFNHHHDTTNSGLSLKEIDWGPKLPNTHIKEQVNWGAHYSSVFLYIQQIEHD